MTRQGLQHRLAAWADSRLLPAGVVILLAVDLAIGLNWLVAPPEALTSPAYRVAKQLLPMDAWGLVFIVLALVTTAAYVKRGRSFLAGVLLGGALAGQWFLWAFLFTVAPIGTASTSLAGTAFAGGLLLLHVLFGLALTHLPRRTERG